MTTPSTQADARPEVAIADQVAEAIKNATTTDDGKLKLPENLSPELKYAAEAELRVRQAQSWGNKQNKRAKELEASNEALSENITVPISVSAERQAELDALKIENPEEWRNQLNIEESKAKEKFGDTVKSISKKKLDAKQLQEQAEAMSNFVANNPNLGIDEDYLKYDVPLRLTKQYQDGSMSMPEFLEAVKQYKETGTVVLGAETSKQPQMKNADGSDQPGKDGTKPAFDYTKALL